MSSLAGNLIRRGHEEISQTESDNTVVDYLNTLENVSMVPYYDVNDRDYDDDAMAGAAVAVQTFGDFQNFNPHLHIIVKDGCFYGDGFLVCKSPDHKVVEDMFRREVFKILKSEGRIGDMLIDNLMNWRHSGFTVYCGNTLWLGNRKGP